MRPVSLRRAGRAFLLAVVAGLAWHPLGAKVLVTAEDAVREAFADASAPAERRTAYLSPQQAARIETLAGSAPSSRIVITWTATKEGKPLRTAYLETHVVRTLPESILVLLGPEGRVQKVEILSFDEPDEYLPRPRWLAQFQGRALDSEMSLRGAIRGITGATLSSRAITSAVRRVLATHALLAEAERGKSPAAAPASAPSAMPPAAAPASAPSGKPGKSGNAP